MTRIRSERKYSKWFSLIYIPTNKIGKTLFVTSYYPVFSTIDQNIQKTILDRFGLYLRFTYAYLRFIYAYLRFTYALPTLTYAYLRLPTLYLRLGRSSLRVVTVHVNYLQIMSHYNLIRVRSISTE